LNWTKEDLARMAKSRPKVAAAGMDTAERDDQKALANALERQIPVKLDGSRAPYDGPQQCADAPRIAAAPERSIASGTAPQPEIRQNGEVRFTIPGKPVPKPRMTRADRWKKRPAVMRYRAWADRARAAAPPEMTNQPSEVEIVAYIEMPRSWSCEKKANMRGRPHRQTPDIDNCVKAVLDALWEEDSMIYRITASKFWSMDPRLEITVR